MLEAFLAKTLFGKEPVQMPEAPEQYLAEAKAHAVTALFFQALPAGTTEAYGECKQVCKEALIKNSKAFLSHVQAQKLLTKAGIACCVIKGVASAKYYPEPLLRNMGDTDLLLHTEDMQHACRVLEEQGYTRLDSPNEHHVHFDQGADRVELHFSLPGMPQNEQKEAVQGFVEDIFDRAVAYQTDFGSVTVPCDFHHGLIQLLHVQEHLFTEGIGLRHLCDWAVFVAHFTPSEFENMFRAKLKQTGLWRFACILSLAAVHVGLDEQEWMGAYGTGAAEALWQDICLSGNFGKKDASRRQAGKLLQKPWQNGTQKNAFAQFFSYISYQTKLLWPVFQQHRILLPFGVTAYLVRAAFRVLTGKTKTAGIKESVTGSRQRYEIYQEFKLFETEN